MSGAELSQLDGSNDPKDKESIENKLGHIFKRIARWEAILLFDEAETFVASRQEWDGKWNALTSSTSSIQFIYNYP
jgi:hypothetical protein